MGRRESKVVGVGKTGHDWVAVGPESREGGMRQKTKKKGKNQRGWEGGLREEAGRLDREL